MHLPSDNFYFQKELKDFCRGKKPTAPQLEGTWILLGITSLPDRRSLSLSGNFFDGNGLKNKDHSFYSYLLFENYGDLTEPGMDAQVTFNNMGYANRRVGPLQVSILGKPYLVANFNYILPFLGQESYTQFSCRIVKKDHLLCALTLRIAERERMLFTRYERSFNGKVYQFQWFHKQQVEQAPWEFPNPFVGN